MNASRQEGTVPRDRALHGRTQGQLLAAAAAAVARGDDLDDSLAQLLGLAAEAVDADRGAVYISDNDTDSLGLSVTLAVEAATADAHGVVDHASESPDVLADVARSRRPAPLDDAARVAVLSGATTGVVVPLVVRRDGIELTLGVMALGFAGAADLAASAAAVEPLADLAAVAVERAFSLSAGSEKAEWFDRLTHTDLVTGLANRRATDQMLQMEVARAGRQGSPVSVAIFEVDGLAGIQRESGNGAGDQALKRVAQVLAGSVRLVDTIGRYGEDKFVLVAPGSDGMTVVERLVRAVAALPRVSGHSVSVSAGLASFPIDGHTSEDLLGVAEEMAGQARNSGGNRVVARQHAAS